MVRIQLETGYLDVKEGTNFPLNFSLGDIRDISKRNGSFSKTITLEGTDNNHKLLNHYYDANIVEGTFNINTLTKCQVIQGGQPILDNSYVQLIKIIKSQTTDAHDQDVTYEVLIKDATSELFTKIGNKELTALDFSDYDSNADANEVYTAAKVVESFSHDITDGFKYLMPWDTDNLYNVRAFHPAIYAKLYFDKIFADAGFTYEWGNLTPSSGATSDGNFFEKLIIPYNGATPKINRDSYIVEASKTAYATAQTGNDWSEQIVSWTEDLDAESIFDNTNGDYSVPFWIQNPENVTVRVTANFDLDIINNEAGTVYRQPLGAFNSLSSISVLEQGGTNEPSFTFNTDALATSYATGTTNLVSGQDVVFEIPITNLDNSDILEFYVKNEFPQYYETTSYSVAADVDTDITFNTLAIEIIPSSNTLGYNSNLELSRYIPNKVKQSDFVKSIFQMYNLFAEPDPTQPNKIILQHRDDYYDAGAEVDWTDKLAKNKPQTLRFLPELSSKKQVLTYKEDKDDANTTYLEATKEVYGQLEFTFDNEYTRGIDKKELLFSPTPIAASSFNAILPILSYEPNTNIRILIDGGTQTTNEFDIYNYYTGNTGVGSTDQTTAPLLTHFDDPINPSFDINFGVCDYYFYNEFNSKTNNNLYNNYWRRTLGQIDKGKMMTAYFDLNEADIQKLQLNDKIRISNSWWNINKVIDYNANIKGLTKVELLSVDEEIQFTPYADTPSYPPVKPHVGTPIRPVKPVKPTKPETVRPVKDVIEANTRNKNLYTTNQKTWIHGINNQVGADVKSAIIIGDNKTVTKDGVYAPTLEATEELILPDGTIITSGTELNDNFANTDLTFNADRTHNTDGNALRITTDGGTYTESLLIFTPTLFTSGWGGNNFSAASGYSKVSYSGIERLTANATELVINETGASYDFRVEGDTDANLIFADASTDRVGIGTNTPGNQLHIYDSGATALEIEASTDNGAHIYLKNTSNEWKLSGTGSSSSSVFQVKDETGGTVPFKIYPNAPTDAIRINTTQIQINDGGADLDVRIEGTGTTSLFRTDAGNDRVGIGTGTPQNTLHVYRATANNFLLIQAGSDELAGVEFKNPTVEWRVYAGDAASSEQLIFRNVTSNLYPIRLASDTPSNTIRAYATELVINENANSYDFRVEGDTDANLLFTDGSADRVGIGTNSPSSTLHVAGVGLGLTVGDSGGTDDYWIRFRDSSSNGTEIGYNNSINGMLAHSNGAKGFHVAVGSGGAFDAAVAADVDFEVDSNNSIVIGKKAELATTATDGFLYLPCCDGTPTGVPTDVTGKMAFVVDVSSPDAPVIMGYSENGSAWVAI